MLKQISDDFELRGIPILVKHWALRSDMLGIVVSIPAITQIFVMSLTMFAFEAELNITS